MSFKIKKVKAREVLDSRGNPTVEVEVSTKSCVGMAIVPSGASRGKHEALELRDHEKRYLGLGVKRAVNNVNKIISKKIIGIDVRKQNKIDKIMIDLDGTHDKSRLGANAILGVSMASARTAALYSKKPLYKYLNSITKNKKNTIPIPFMNIINGGKHADSKLSFQEFMIVPMVNNFKESLRMAAETYHVLKKIIHKKYGRSSANIGDEGGFVPPVKSAEQALNLIVKAINELGYQKRIGLAMDAAASSFYRRGTYIVDGKRLNFHGMLKYYLHLVRKYPMIISIEDPFAEDNFEEFSRLKKELKNVQIVGDDLLVTDYYRVKKAINLKACNCLLLKINQVGTLTEAVKVANLAMKHKWTVMMSHRSGETEDSFIADLAVSLGCSQIKAGAPCRSERLAKYNQLLRIEEQKVKFAKWEKHS